MHASNAESVVPERGPVEPAQTTLLDLVDVLAHEVASDAEVVAAVADLINSGRVRLVGSFCDRHVRIVTHGSGDGRTVPEQRARAARPQASGSTAFASGSTMVARYGVRRVKITMSTPTSPSAAAEAAASAGD